ncbi:MAG: DUF4126 domain-containing protein [Opitutaceae bacterium]|nr:DUF4126 domain-containing protein [Opitutaceae bacterium]
MDTALSIAIGIGLSAACGFRIFIPLLAIAIAGHTGHIQLAPDFAWMHSETAITIFATAAIAEVIAYFIPVIDNLLDSMASPLAIIAGTILTASMVTDISPVLRWTLAIIAGGGIAGLIQGASLVTRTTSTVATAGIGNIFISFFELLGALFISIISLSLPFAALAIVIILIILFLYSLIRKQRRKFTLLPN